MLETQHAKSKIFEKITYSGAKLLKIIDLQAHKISLYFCRG